MFVRGGFALPPHTHTYLFFLSLFLIVPSFPLSFSIIHPISNSILIQVPYLVLDRLTGEETEITTLSEWPEAASDTDRLNKQISGGGSGSGGGYGGEGRRGSRGRYRVKEPMVSNIKNLSNVARWCCCL